MSLLFSQLLRRASCIRLAREDATDVLQSVVTLASRCDAPTERRALSHVFHVVAKYDNSLVVDALQRARLDPHDETDGASAALLAVTLPRLHCDERVWEGVLATSESGLATGKWRAGDCRSIVFAASKWGVYPRATFPASVEKYVAARVFHSSPSDLLSLSAMMTSLPETFKSTLMLALAQRAVVLADRLSAKIIGGLCRNFLRAKYDNVELIAALIPQMKRTLADMTIVQAASCFAMCTSHPSVGCADTAFVASLLTRISETIEDADTEAVLLLLRALRRLPEPCRLAVHADWQLTVASLSDQCNLLLTDANAAASSSASDDNGFAVTVDDNKPSNKAVSLLSVETTTMLLLRYFSLLQAVPAQEELSIAAKNGIIAFAEHVTSRIEDFVADENPPFPVVLAMIEAPVKESGACAVAIIEEAADQTVEIPTLTVFRLLVALADHKLFSVKAFAYLRRSFTETARNIPLIQLVTALKCFAMAHVHSRMQRATNAAASDHGRGADDEDAREADERESAERADFLGECLTLLKTNTERKDMVVALALAHAIHEMNCPSSNAFWDFMLSVFLGAHNTVDGSCKPLVHFSESAAAALAGLGEGRLAAHPALHGFLNDVARMGKSKAEDHHQRPSSWMRANDPTRALEPLTPEQQQMRDLIEEMKAKKGHETQALEGLLGQYNKLLPHCRPEDLWMPFEVFADKVVKSDKLLHETLKHIIANDLIKAVSPFCISSILQSLAILRFTFHVTVKKFLLAVSEDQWNTFDGASLRIVVSSMSRLSLRLSAVLMQIGERLIFVVKQLTPTDIGMLVSSLQTLGFHEESVMTALMNRARDISIDFSPVSLEMLFTAPYVARLLTSADVAEPLLMKLAATSSEYAPGARQRIASNLKKSPVARELIGSTLTSLEGGGIASQAKRLGGSVMTAAVTS